MAFEDEKTPEELAEELVETQNDIADFLDFEPSETEPEPEESEDENGESDEVDGDGDVDETVDDDEASDVDDSSDSDDNDDSDDDVDDGSDDEADEPAETDTDEVDESEEPETELTLANKRIAQLQELIETQALQALGQPITPKTETTEQPTSTEETSETVETPKTSVAEMLGEVDFEELRDDPEKFVAFVGKAIEATRQHTINEMQGQLPQSVNERVTQAVAMQKLVDDFYSDNSALAGAKQTVSIVARNVGAEHPDWNMKQVLDEAGKRTRTMLGISETEVIPAGKKTKPTRKGKKPAVPTKVNGKRKTAPKKLSKQQKQINEIIDLF